MKISRDIKLLIWATLSVLFVFMLRSNTFATPEFKLLASDGAAGDNFGESVSISGDVALVGADGDDDNGNNSGSAYVYVLEVQPDQATLISPSGTITENNPTCTWSAVETATWYYLWVNDSTGNKIKKWYTADEANCGNGTGECSVTDTTVLADGLGKWWIQTWNVYGYGPWSDAMSFTVDTGAYVPPEKATLISPSGTITENNPTYTWSAVETATWYYLWVNDSTGNKIKKWYTADEANCGNGTGECSVTDTTVLADGLGKWWIQTWNVYGYGPWSDAMSFTVDTGAYVPPEKATLISPSGTITENNPTYTWSAVETATWYYLWVNDSTGNKIKKWYTADEANCGNGTGECSVTDTTVLADGLGKWWIQTWNVYGYGPWSDAMSFTVDTGAIKDCQLPVGHNDYCRDCGPCAVGEGDCDSDSECLGALTCPQVTGTDTCQEDMLQEPAPVPQTGQTQSYAPGDDGGLQMGVQWPYPRFTDNSDGTVTDQLTGLVWLKNADCFGWENWNAALQVSNNLTDGQCGLSDGSNIGDWRLPNIKELYSLIDHGHLFPVLPSGHPFTGVQFDYYWTSTSRAHFPNERAWSVYMNNGHVGGSNYKAEVCNVWPVRSGNSVPLTGQTQSYASGDDGDLQMGVQWPYPRFTDNSDGTVTDHLTGLVWLKNADCFGWENWNASLQVSNNLADGQCGLSDDSSIGDWRLPNVNELYSLIDHGHANPALPSGHPFTGVRSDYYWTSTSRAPFPYERAYTVYMQSGMVESYYYYKDEVYNVWPVRSGN